MTNRFLAQDEIDALLKRDEGADEEEILGDSTGVPGEEASGAAGADSAAEAAEAGGADAAGAKADGAKASGAVDAVADAAGGAKASGAVDAASAKAGGADAEDAASAKAGGAVDGAGSVDTDAASAKAGGAVDTDAAGAKAGGAVDDIEKDALGEIGNISMGSAATTLSQILGKEVRITSPKVSVCTAEGLFARFTIPRLLVKVKFREGLSGYNLLIMKINDAAVLANLMMGGNGTDVSEELTEMEISAASEAMNQMIGTASTSLASMFQRAINIEPPVSIVLDTEDAVDYDDVVETDEVVMVEFRMLIKDLLDTQIMQIMSVETAKEKATLLLGGVTDGGGGATEETPSGEEVATSAAAEAAESAASDLGAPGTAEADAAEADAGAAVSSSDAEIAAAEAAMDALDAANTPGVPGMAGADAGAVVSSSDAEVAAAEAAMDALDAANVPVVPGMAGADVASAEAAMDALDAANAPVVPGMAGADVAAEGVRDPYAVQAAHAAYAQEALARPTVQASSPEPSAATAAPYDKQKIDLLLDIPLRVTVVLGRTRRPIKEVLGMTSGSIVELAALVDEPVEVQVNGTLVAKGEVVVVNENFGVRITEILSPTERLQQLKQ